MLSKPLSAFMVAILLAAATSQLMRAFFQPTPYQLPPPTYLANKTFNNERFALDFAQLESILWQIKITDQKELIIDHDLLNKLQQVTGRLIGDISIEDNNRLRLLVAKSLPGKAGEKLSLLINQHRLFNKAQAQANRKIQSAVMTADLTTLMMTTEANRERQTDFFGEHIANQLFAEQNKTWDHLITTQIKQVEAAIVSETQ